MQAVDYEKQGLFITHAIIAYRAVVPDRDKSNLKFMTQAEIQKIDVQVAKAIKAPAVKASSTDNLKKQWALIKPIMLSVTALIGFWKPDWVKVINRFMAAMDAFVKTPKP